MQCHLRHRQKCDHHYSGPLRPRERWLRGQKHYKSPFLKGCLRRQVPVSLTPFAYPNTASTPRFRTPRLRGFYHRGSVAKNLVSCDVAKRLWRCLLGHVCRAVGPWGREGGRMSPRTIPTQVPVIPRQYTFKPTAMSIINGSGRVKHSHLKILHLFDQEDVPYLCTD